MPTEPSARPVAGYFLQGASPRLHALLERLAGLRMVFFAGLPATGKSLLVNQLAHLAAGRGRRVHLLQWDVVRPIFEATEAGRRYPAGGGQANPALRPCIGRWARGAVGRWHRDHPDPADLLIGETPLVGGRFIELTLPMDDETEPLLAGEACQFVLPAPTNAVRRHIEGQRERRAAAPRHQREREDATPQVLRAVWPEVLAMAAAAGLPADPAAGTGSYDEGVFRAVYQHLLRHRPLEVVTIDEVLPTGSMSVYDLAVACREVAPTPDEADAFIRAWEAAARSMTGA